MIDALALALNVHAVIADGRAVFLDVSGDRYFKLGLAHTEILKGRSCPRRDRLVASLIRKGLATETEVLEPAAPAEPTIDARAQNGAGVCSVMGACHWAATSLRKRSFAEIVRWARSVRKGDARAWEGGAPRFLSRRPFYARDYNCLFDSLALIRFLRVRNAAASWVFGVRGAPFAAHCWIEVAGVCVNDDPDFVAPYTPILTL